MEQRKGARNHQHSVTEDPLQRSGTGAYPRDEFDGELLGSAVTSQDSQVRRRSELEQEQESPGFVLDDPVEGVPTPRPKMPLSCIPRRAMHEREMLSLPLDHRAGFLLAHVDGDTDLRTIIDVSGMPQDETVALVERLVALQVIRLK